MSDWIINLIRESGYLGVGLLMFIETVFPPVPSEVIMSIAGVESARGHMTLPGVIVAGTVGAMAGNYLWYQVARLIGVERLRPLVDRYGRWLTLDWREVEKGQHLFERYGSAFVLFSRMLPTLRSLISIPAGLLKMPLATFLLWSTIGTAGWTAMLAIAGHQLGQRFEEVETVIGPVSTAVVVLIVGAYLWRLIFWRPRR